MKAVEAIFPELNWEESKLLFFSSIYIFFIIIFIELFYFIYILLFSEYHWKSPTNRRQFFERFANEKNFDALIADNWYSVQVNDIQAFRVLK